MLHGNQAVSVGPFNGGSRKVRNRRSRRGFQELGRRGMSPGIQAMEKKALLYVITESNRDTIINTVNNDLQALMDWGADNHTTFEKTKTHMIVVSNKNASAFDPTGIVMGGHEVEQLEELKLMGYIFDEALSWGPTIGGLAKKVRTRTDAIRRMSRSLDSENMFTMYSAFVRPILEYGSMMHMGATPTHLTLAASWRISQPNENPKKRLLN